MLEAGLARFSVLYLSSVLLGRPRLFIRLIPPSLLDSPIIVSLGIVRSIVGDAPVLCFWDACCRSLFELLLNILFYLVLLENEASLDLLELLHLVVSKVIYLGLGDVSV